MCLLALFAENTIQDETKGSPFRLFRHCATFFKFFFPTKGPPSIFRSFATVLKIPKGPPFQFSRHCETFFPNKFHKSVSNSPILGNFEVLVLFLSLGYGADLFDFPVRIMSKRTCYFDSTNTSLLTYQKVFSRESYQESQQNNTL